MRIFKSIINSDLRSKGKSAKISLFLLAYLGFSGVVNLVSISAGLAKERIKSFAIVVNGNGDDTIADGELTLREAIELVNGDRLPTQLSSAELGKIKELAAGERSAISFDLPTDKTKIELTRELPAIEVAGVTIDGTTQGNYQPIKRSGNNISLGKPVVQITPKIKPDSPITIERGLTLFADNITIRGLSIYGFNIATSATQNVPGGDIFIADRNYRQSISTIGRRNFANPPENILIEQNYLGTDPNRSARENNSDFGIYAFNSHNTIVRHNAIINHNASAIITGLQASGLTIEENLIVGNGTSGMPDAIRLEGEIPNNRISSNLICGNDGSAIFLFKPRLGNVKIDNNTIAYNGRRMRRAAIYLMGSDRLVVDNKISHQAGSGVAITAIPQSESPNGDISSARNIIDNNHFSDLEGLSIDLNTYRHDSVENFENGDGVNPPRNSENRRLDTANMAINSPVFLAREFYTIDGKTGIDGTADPQTKIQLYRVVENTHEAGPLNEPLATIIADDRGRFSTIIETLKPGDRISAIATDIRYGTSEPARNATISSPSRSANLPTQPDITPATCHGSEYTFNTKPLLTPIVNTIVPPTPIPTPTPTPSAIVTPPPVRFQAYRNVHFALDRSDLSPISRQNLDQVVKVLQEHPYLTLDLVGHTDNRASNDYNERLGMRRAISTRNYLLSRGISPARLTIRSAGERQLLERGTSIREHARNRRVEMIYRDLRGINLEVIDLENDIQLERVRQ